MNTLHSYTITLDEDPETGDLILPLPDEVLARAGWAEGDTLNWLVQDDGSIIVSKVEQK